MFSGSFVAIITPFFDSGDKKGQIDYEGLGKLIEFHIDNGTSGIVPCGTTGESATLTHDEHNEVIKYVVEKVNKRVPVIAGTGSNSTHETISLTRYAKKVGADAALIITPYYNKPMQKGLVVHYSTVAEEVDIPIVMYNVPGRTGLNMLPETVAELAKIKNIVAVKEASGILDQVSNIIQLCGKDIDVMSGDDALTLPMLSLGAKGVISVVANIVPQDMVNMIKSFKVGNLEGAQKLHYKMFPLIKAMFMETNPIPVKTAAGLMNISSAELRLPLTPMSEGNLTKLKEVMKKCNLI